MRWIDLCRPSSREINKSTAISSTPPTSTSRKTPDPLWYLRHGWWKWPLKPVLLKVEIELFHICVAKIAMATAYVHPFIQISFICTPKYAHWFRTASYLQHVLHMYTHSASSTSYVHPFRQCKLHMYTQHMHWSASYVTAASLRGRMNSSRGLVLKKPCSRCKFTEKWSCLYLTTDPGHSFASPF